MKIQNKYIYICKNTKHGSVTIKHQIKNTKNTKNKEK